MRALTDEVRRVAFDVLRAVDENDAYVNLLLPTLLRERGIADRDAAFATELTHGTLRRQGSYDAVLDRVTSRGVDAVDPPVRDVLRLGTHQLLSLRTPSHAAVSTSVDLVRSAVGHRPASFVNAVLRQVAQKDFAMWMDQVAPDAATDPVGHLATVHSHPRWVVEAMRDALRGDLVSTAELLAADNDAPGVTLVVRPGWADAADLGGVDVRAGRYSPHALYLDAGDPGQIAAVRDGRAGVQDEGSQLVALALAQAPVDGADERWLDLCAGPGGKAALLAALAGGRGATLVANDVLPHRTELVAKALRQATNATVHTGDGREHLWGEAAFDRVLIDAPCTGLGALRRRPEARWRRRPSDVAPLATLQGRLLDSALYAVRPGGVVAYATCSPHRGETTGVVEAALSRHPDVEVLDAPSALPQVGGMAGPYVQLWPHVHGTDAMFLALLRRTGEVGRR